MNELAAPVLRPPRGELPPSFWQQHHLALIFGLVGLVLLASVLVWLLFRKRSAPAVPPQLVARKALESLAGLPENGLVLSQISRTIKRYFADAFRLPDYEMTTGEFCRELSRARETGPGPEVADKTTSFLRRCDEQKFAPSPRPSSEEDAVVVALELVSLGEKRREELRRPAPSEPATEAAVKS